jgi:hypothetical protein
MLEEDSIAWLGLHKQEAEPEDMPDAREIYEQQLKPDAPELLVRKLHHSAAMENDAFWTETVAKEFEALNDPELQGATKSDEDESAQMFGNEMDIDEMARLLAGGMQSCD